MDNMSKPFPAPPGYRWVFCRSYRHWRTGKQVYPKRAEYFRFLVRVKR